MRELACISLLALLGAVACSGGEDGPRRAVETAGTANGGSAGGAVLPTGGSTSQAGTASSAGAPVGSAGTSNQAGGAPIGGSGGDGKAHVITWVPPYLVGESKAALGAVFEGASMADGLSYLALQFWVTDGPATHLDQVTDADITWFHDWARQHGVKILLCVHNNTGEWNWPEGKRAFKDNREAFATHLASQVMSRDLDGVDIDIEGIIDSTEDDRQSYLAFVQTLSGKLRPLGKTLTLDSFHSKWNAPNWDWWPELLPLVDGITSMGYETSGMGVDYQELVDHAALAPNKLMIGVPSYQGAWLGHTVDEQLGWLANQGHVGTAIWDASLRATEWRRRAVWDQLKAIKSR
jgi:hypothetical protein